VSAKLLIFQSKHYLKLTGIILLGVVLRFWQLDLKPLWPDEVITALFSLGRNYNDVPLNILFPLSRLDQIFTLQPAIACPQIAQAVAAQSVHPPLFFCLMHSWLSWISPNPFPLAWELRAFPAFIGVAAIPAVYCLNRVAFSPAAGLMAAAVMAVSPFAVYLSQEARHYTLPMLLIVLGLLGLIRVQQDFQQQQWPPWFVWLGWIAVNSLGFYVHYFFMLAFTAQITTLVSWMVWQRRQLPRRYWATTMLAVTGIVLSYLPWLSTLLGHFSRPETDWLKLPSNEWTDSVVPLYQTLAGWVIMAIVLPVENQPLWLAIPAALLMLLYAGWLGWQVVRGVKRLWRSPATHLASLTLISFTGCVLLQFLGIVYLLGKDITVAPRYNFAYFPGICALAGAGLAALPNQPSQPRWPLYAFPSVQVRVSVLLVGLLSGVFVTSNWAFQKPFAPQQVARDISQAALPLAVMVGYDTFQDVALGLSYALEINRLYPGDRRSSPEVSFAFFNQSQNNKSVWNLPQLSYPGSTVKSHPGLSPLNLWLIAPRHSQSDYPSQLSLASQSGSLNDTQTLCTIDSNQYHRVFSVPYQLYRCTPEP